MKAKGELNSRRPLNSDVRRHGRSVVPSCVFGVRNLRGMVKGEQQDARRGSVLTYEDGIAALEWLAEVFGFTETARFTSSDGRLSHGEMSIGDGLIMLASPSADYEGPKRHRGNCEIAASWSALPWIIDGVLVYVEDVDEHYARAKAAGAVILSEPEDGPPARRYRVEDLEGHRWMFMAQN